MKERMLEARYPFIREDTFLVAQVDSITGSQRLLMQKLDMKTGSVLFEASINCIHVAVCDIPVGNFEATVGAEDFERKILQIRSSEQIREISLSPGEKFVAFRSWVAGIAEAGIESFKLQGELDKALRVQYPLATPLLHFLVHVDGEFITTFIEYVEQVCRYQGGHHYPCILANLLPLLNTIIWNPCMMENLPDDYYFREKTSQLWILEKSAEILTLFFAIIPPLTFFEKNPEYLDIILVPQLRKIIDQFLPEEGGKSLLQRLIDHHNFECPVCGRTWHSEAFSVDCDNCGENACSYCIGIEHCAKCGKEVCTNCKIYFKKSNGHGVLCLKCAGRYGTHGRACPRRGPGCKRCTEQFVCDRRYPLFNREYRPQSNNRKMPRW